MHEESKEAAESVDARCARVPIRLVPMTVAAAGGEGPMLDRLALVGEPVTTVIGRPVLATSDVDVAGISVVYFGAIAQSTPTGLRPSALLGMVSIALLTGFFTFLVAMLMLESRVPGATVPGLLALLSMPLAAFLTYRFGWRPPRQGWTCVVGEQGFQVGTVNGEVFDRIVVRYDDPSDVWFEATTVGVLKGTTAMTSINRALTICSAEDLSTTVQAFGWMDRGGVRRPLAEFGASRVEAERFIAISEAWERARIVRLAMAWRDLEAGRPITLPVLDGRRVVLGLEGGAPSLEILRGKTTLLRGGAGEARVSIREGVYEISAGGKRETIDRHDLGNPYVLDGVLLGVAGMELPSEGPIPRRALVPEAFAERQRY